jgi:transcriptional regulator with XRE-family HTH domain
MAPNYVIHFAAQLRQHLRALRKHRGITQTRLGQLLGVSQARIAEIEANPGLVNLDQMLQIFSALDVTLYLAENHPVPLPAAEDTLTPINRIKKTTPAAQRKFALGMGQRYSQDSFAPRYSVNAPRVHWNATQINHVADAARTSVPAAPVKAQADSSLEFAKDKGTTLDAAQSRQQGTESDAQPISNPSFNFGPKKGSW